MLSLLGTRAVEIAGDVCEPSFRGAVDTAVRQSSFSAMLFERALGDATNALEDAGIAALPLKGVALGQRLYGDAGMRPTGDTDVLVAACDLDAAIAVLETCGYRSPGDPAWIRERPLLHYTLVHRDAHVPPLELHWRIHWSETRFSEALIASSSRPAGGWRVPEPAAELASLLLFYARDGFAGLRLAADIATWWDRLGELLGPDPLDPYLRAHPSLRRSLEAAIECCERVVGLPGDRLAQARAADRSAHRAVAAADPHLVAGADRGRSKVMAVDFLLSTGRDKLGFVRRYAVHPLGEVRRMYGLEDRSRGVVIARSAVHAAGAVVKGGPRMAREIIAAEALR